MLKVLIFDGSKELYSASASSVSLPGKAGEFEILPFHAPMISLLRAGEIRIVPLETGASSAAGKTLRIRGGFTKMEKNELTILVER